MKKAKIISLNLLADSQDCFTPDLEEAVYVIFEAITEQDPKTRGFAAALGTLHSAETARRRVLIDRLIDRSVVKAVDLDGDGRKELMIYFNCQGTPDPSNAVYIMRRMGRDWECIGKFHARSLPEVQLHRKTNGFAELEGTRPSFGGVIVPSRYSFRGGRYDLDERTAHPPNRLRR